MNEGGEGVRRSGRRPPPVQIGTTFRCRTTKGERRAVDKLVELRDAQLRTANPNLAQAGQVGWFRATIHRLAAEEGVEIVEEEQVKPTGKAGRTRKK